MEKNSNDLSYNNSNNEDKILTSKYKSFSQTKNTFPICIKIQKNSQNNIDSLDLSNSYKIIQNNNNSNFKEDFNYHKSNSNISTSNLELLQKNEGFFIKMRLGETKDKMTVLKKNLNRKINDISALQDEIKKLKIQKDIKRNELENLLSNKESFEEIFRSLITDNWEQNSQRTNYNKIKLDINDIENYTQEKFVEEIKFIFENLNILYNENNIKEISKEIEDNILKIKNNKKSTDEEKINKFILEIYQKIKNETENIIPNIQLQLLLKYTIKLISLENRIQNDFNFINKIYKEKKKEAKEKISELTSSKQLLNEKIEQSKDNISNLENKMHLCGRFSRNKSSLNQFRKNFLSKESKTDYGKYFNKKNKVTTRENIYLNYNNYKRKPTEKNLKSSRKKLNHLINKLEENEINKSQIYIIKTQITPNSSNRSFKIPISNYNKSMIQQTFCYFKFISKNSIKFNPLKNFDISPESLGYYKGFISVDFTKKCLSFITMDNDIHNLIINQHYKSLQIQLDKISNIFVDNIMKDIIKIYMKFIKFYQKCEINNCYCLEDNFSLNKLIHLKEFNNINLDTNQRIKATQNKYFPFLISISDIEDKFEIIFIDYSEFKNWFKGIEVIVKNNKKKLNKNEDEIIIQKLQHSKKNNSFSYKY